MTQIRTTTVVSVAAVLATVLACVEPTLAQDTTFIYQGELRDNSGRAAGLFDMSFSLWSAAIDGAQIGSTVDRPGIEVTEGRFTVQLDMGANAFDNSSRWLQITVEGFTLSPRQPITRAPYSIQTRGIFVDDNNNVGIGTLTPIGRLDVGGGHLVVTGASTSNCCVAHEDPGCDDWDCQNLVCRESPNKDEYCCMLPYHQGCADLAATVCSICQPGNVGIGNPAPVNKLSVAGNADFSGDVGIGTTAPSARLHVVGDATINGEFKTGSYRIKPALAYGSVCGSGSLLATSNNVVSISGGSVDFTPGSYTIEIAGGLLATDVVHVTGERKAFVTARVSNEKLLVNFYEPILDNQRNSDFSFVIYRP